MLDIVLEMANNHSGNVEKGVAIIEAFAPLIEEFPSLRFSFKFQYRDPSILHPTLTSKLTERVRSTMLSERDRFILRNQASGAGFQVGCTPFDEPSVDMINKHSYDFVKVASCSLTDWPLLELVAALKMPTIASTGGEDLDDAGRAAMFLKRRVPELTLMHCVSMYPCRIDNLGMDRIDRLKEFGCPVGYSMHDLPDENIGAWFAIAKGCRTLEWHVDIDDKRNPYSLDVAQTSQRLKQVVASLLVCSPVLNYQEDVQLQQLRRGAFATKDLIDGDSVTLNDVVFQLPAQHDQLTADDFGKYAGHKLTRGVAVGQPISRLDVETANGQELVQRMADKVQAILDASGAVLPRPAKLVLSHHKGLANFERVGCGQVECVNGDQYAKKLIVLLPGQRHPVHTHRQKTETFNVLLGVLKLVKDGGHFINVLTVGQSMTVPAGQDHTFSSSAGCVFEEISTRYDPADSFYEEPVDAVRKTEIWLP
jgi:sialic acid synthase SpsE/mannose-6-phosphate isomerase-like protein (cupin superfamily)